MIKDIIKDELSPLLYLHACDSFLFTCISDLKRYKIAEISSFVFYFKKLSGHLASFGSSFLLEGLFL